MRSSGPVDVRSEMAEALARCALRCFPLVFRQRFGESMVETFRESYREFCQENPSSWRRLGFCAETCLALAAQGMRERRRPAFYAWKRPPTRDASLSNWLLQLLREVRYAARLLVRRPAVSLPAIVTLALGIGASSTIFSVVNAVLLQPLPFPEPDGIISVSSEWRGPQPEIGRMSFPDVDDLERGADSIETLIGLNTSSMTLTRNGETRVLTVARVTAGLMAPLRTTPYLGRDVRVEEVGPESPAVVVIGFGFWKSRFGSDPGILGQGLTLNNESYEIIGVAPPGFSYPHDIELWIPRDLDLESCGRACHTLHVVGRLSPEASLEQASAEVALIAENLSAEYPESNTNKSFVVGSLHEEIVGEVRPGLVMMLGAVALVVLIACANVANLLLVHAANRRREIAVRTAIGASRRNLLTQTAVESSLLALLGGAGGLLVTHFSLKLIPTFVTGIPRIHSVAIDHWVVLFTLCMVLVVALLFGSAPAFAFLRSSFRSGLAGASGGGETQSRQRFRGLLLVGELALSALLLVGAGLLVRSFGALYAVDLGFDPAGLVRFNTLLPRSEYSDLAQVRNFYRDLEARATALASVEAAASGWGPPLGRGSASGDLTIAGRPIPAPGTQPEASVKPIGPGWFETMRIDLVAGRPFEPRDDAGSEAVVWVNETLVHQNFADSDPLGEEIDVSIDFGHGSVTGRIVGVVADIRGRRIHEAPEPTVYVPHGRTGPNTITVTIRTRPGVPPPIRELREIVTELDPAVPIYRIETLDQAIGEQVAPTRFYLVLSLVFAALAAILAAVGLYSVVAYSVSHRRYEIGLRAALGASRSGLVRMVLATGMKPALLGLAVGLVGSWFCGRILAAILYGVDGHDLWVFGATGLLLVVVSVSSTLVPAWRASRIDPASALRQE